LSAARSVFKVVVQTFSCLHYVHHVVGQTLTLGDKIDVEHAELIAVATGIHIKGNGILLRLRYTDVTMLLQLGPLLLTVIMVYYDGHLHVGHKRLYLMSELTGKGSIIMDGDIGDYID